MVLWIATRYFLILLTGLLPPMVELSNSIQLQDHNFYVTSTTPETSFWFGLFPFRSPLLRKSIFLSLPLGT